MPRHVPVNADFDAFCKQLLADPAWTPVLAGLDAALGVGPGEQRTVTDFPILGFFISIADGQFLAYAITPGRFLRYEVAGGRSLAIAVPIERVVRVVETAGPSELVVSVELDADARTTITETRTETLDGATPPGTTAGRHVARMLRTSYDIVATSDKDVLALAQFARAARNALGL